MGGRGTTWARAAALAVLVAAVGVTGAGPADAHETVVVGTLRVSVGWADEPPLAGVVNHVEVVVADAAGTRVNDRAAVLQVEVSFGPERAIRTMVPGSEPGVFLATLLPTRAGMYGFHVTGTVAGQPLDLASRCSERTFDCVGEASEIQFPARDPTVGELAARLDREAARGARRADDAGLAVKVAVGAAIAALGAIVFAGLGLRRRAPEG